MSSRYVDVPKKAELLKRVAQFVECFINRERSKITIIEIIRLAPSDFKKSLVKVTFEFADWSRFKSRMDKRVAPSWIDKLEVFTNPTIILLI